MSPATYQAEHLTSRAERRLVEFDPDATALTLVTLNPADAEECLPIKEFRRFLAGAMVSVGGEISGFEIVAATSAAGADATVIVAHALASAPDAVGDTVWLECDAEQAREVLSNATHIGVRVSVETATDECVVSFERAEPFYPHAGLTADLIA